MDLKVFLKVKFRWAGITFGTLAHEFRFDVPAAAIFFAEQLQDGLKYDNRGVKITTLLVPK